MKYTIQNRTFWLLLLACMITLIPFLGFSEYYSNGEPRESIVSYTMIVSDNWTLPRNNGGEMSFKPPFFHWCVAAASLLRGYVTEGATRVPSAMALIGMTLWGFGFFARRKGIECGMLAVLVAFTSYGLHRAGTVCRVDMMLTAGSVCALYALFSWFEQKMRDTGSLITAILLMGLATLTKGPVGTLVPCMVMGVYMLLRGVNFFRAFSLLAAWGLLSLLPYALWFYAAWLEGGQDFLDLVYAENIGRMTSAMGYEPNVQPWTYNVLTVLMGFLPWTVLLFVSLFFLRYRGFRFRANRTWRLLRVWVKRCDPVDLFSLTAIVVIFVFYCIPQSKRPSYLLPIYPFVAYFIAKYILWMAKEKPRVMRVYGALLSVVSLLVFACFLTFKAEIIPDTLFDDNSYVRMLHAVEDIGEWWEWLAVSISALFGLYWWIRQKEDDIHNIYAVTFMTFGLYLSFDGAYAPAILNSQSVRNASIEINRAVPASEGILYEYIEGGNKTKGDPIHFFEVNFYLHNRVENFEKRKPDKGFLLITKGDATLRFPQFEREGYRFKLRYEANRREMQVYEFTKAD